MYPILLKIGPLTIRTYGFLLAVGVLAAIFLALRKGKKAGIDTEVLSDLMFFSILLGLLGAKIFLFFSDVNYYVSNPKEIRELIFQGGTFYGGLIFGLIYAIWFIRKKKLNFKKLGDLLMPCIALAHFFGRLGCFFAGCCWGRDAGSSFLGVTYTNPRCDTGIPLHEPLYPVQVIESLLNLVNFVFLSYLYKRRKFEGQVFVAYIFNYCIIRFVVEYFRGDADYVWGNIDRPWTSLTVAQLISLVGLIAAVLLYRRFRSKSLPTACE